NQTAFSHTTQPNPIDEVHADNLWPGRDLDAEIARILDRKLGAVERHVEICAAEPASTEPTGDVEFVLRVEGEAMTEEHASARSEREALDVTILRQRCWGGIGDLRRRECAIANCAAADLHRG